MDSERPLAGPNCLACRMASVTISRHGISTVICPFLSRYGSAFAFSPASERHAVELCRQECNNYVRINRELFIDRMVEINDMILSNSPPPF